MDYRIEEMKESDWTQVSEIYLEGINTGIGYSLLNHLIKLSEENNYWTLQSGIIRENTPSIELHKKCGFREIGIREKVAKMDNGKWYDTVLMERRSKIVGVD